MSLTLHMHPLSSFCHKVLFAMYENEITFKPRILNLQDKTTCADFFATWPIGKMPLLVDDAKKQSLPETTIILEYLDQNYPGKLNLFPKDLEQCRQARLWDRTLDLYLHTPTQKVVVDLIRPKESRDPYGVEDAKKLMQKTYDLLERHMAKRQWILGDTMSVADCAALPALFYSDFAVPYSKTHPNTAAYFERLYALASVKRVYEEAKPFFKYFPLADKMPARFL